MLFSKQLTFTILVQYSIFMVRLITAFCDNIEILTQYKWVVNHFFDIFSVFCDILSYFTNTPNSVKTLLGLLTNFVHYRRNFNSRHHFEQKNQMLSLFRLGHLWG